MKKAAALLFSCLMVLAAQAQTGQVEGRVQTRDGQPAPFVNVSITGSNKGSVTDERGWYAISGVPTGKQQIQASYVGLQTQTHHVMVVAQQPTRVDFTLREDARMLRQVVILSDAGDPNAKDRQVAKIPLTNLENPQVYSRVSAAVIDQQLIANYDDIFRNVPGMARTWKSTGRASDGAAYFALRGLETQAGLVNGLPGITNGDMDPAGVERVVVLKGPSATLFGPNSSSYASYGGIINTVTKKPYYALGGSLGYIMGSFGLNRLTADINTPLDTAGKMAARINLAYQSEGSFQDAGYKKVGYLAPSFSYLASDRLSFLVVAELMTEKRVVAPMFFISNRTEPLTYKDIDALDLNTRLSFTSNDLPIQNPRTTVQAQMNYILSGDWHSQTVLSRGTAQSEGYYGYLWPDAEGDNNFGEYYSYVNQQNVTTGIQQNFNGDFRLGTVRNRMVLGLDFFSKQAVDNSLGEAFIRNVTPQGAVNYTDPGTGETRPPVYMSRAAIDPLLALTEPGNSRARTSTYGAYVADVINFWPNLAVMAGLRANYFYSDGERSDPEDGYHQFALSPKFGLVYQPLLDKVSLFANYQNGFYQVAPTSVADPDGNNPRLKSFEPEQANQWEAGAKVSLWTGRLFATASYYNIRIKNKVIGDVHNIHNSIQGGAIESKGFEVELNARPVNGMHLIAGYSHNQVENSKGNKGDFYSEPGRAPGGQGPADQLNFWLTYRIPQGRLKNFGAALGGNHASRYRVIDNSITGVFDLPAYTVLNGSLFYESDRFRVALNVNNLTDETYYIGYWSVNPQKPLNFATGLSWKF